jgi:hypothetical protein
MSFIFSRALVEEYSAATSLAGEPSAQLSVMPTPHKFWRNDKTIEHSDHSRFGLTSQLLTECRGEELLTSYLAAFRARTSAELEREQESTASAVVFGPIWLGSFAKYSRDSYSWKTAQCSLLGDSDEFSETWPRWGSMRNGESFLRQIPALPICESASGLLPTPCAIDAGSGRINKSPSPGAAERPTLALMARKNLWPTPTAITSSGGTAMCKWGGSGSREKLRGMVSPEELNGLLNPAWVEWLMGWPIGWTELKPLETAKYHEWLQQHSPFSSVD